jgi:hypothetical protein
MIDHVWTVVCSRAVIDETSKNISIQNVIERFTVEGDPKPDSFIAIPFDVITLWARSDFASPARGRGRTVLLSPAGIQLGSHEFDLDMSGNYRRYRARLHFNGLPANQAGRYVFRVDLLKEGENEWRTVATIPVEVIFEQPDTDQRESEEE